MINKKRTEALLASLTRTTYRRCPKGVGQKTINLAADDGLIQSIKSRDDLRMPDLHRITDRGVAVRKQLRLES